MKQKLQNDLQLGVWEITETDDFLQNQLPWITVDLAMKGHRRTEWLASRVLVAELMSHQGICSEVHKDVDGKPYLTDTDLQLSLSHTRRYAAAIVGSSLVGIDIQVRVDRIHRIAHKFLSTDELSNEQPLTLEELHIYWGAKESMYKIYGRRQVDFRSHLSVSSIDHAAGQLQGMIEMPDYKSTISLFFQVCSEFILVYGWPSASDDTP